MLHARRISVLAVVMLASLALAASWACDGDDEPCRDECTLDDTRCSGTLIEVCGEGTDGCLVWRVTHDCSDQSGTCVEVGDTVGCEPQCDDECETGATDCWDDVVMVCQMDPESGCTTWYVEEDCTTNDEVCDDSGSTATCGPL